MFRRSLCDKLGSDFQYQAGSWTILSLMFKASCSSGVSRAMEMNSRIIGYVDIRSRS